MEKDQFKTNDNILAENTTINAKELFWKYVQHAWLFVLILILSLAAAWVYLRYTTPVYSVSSTLLIRNDNANRSGGGMSSQDMFSDIALFQSNTNKQNEILILSSRTMMERVVKSLDLQKGYSVVGNVKTTDVYPSKPFEMEIISLADSTIPLNLEVHLFPERGSFMLNGDKQEYVMGQIVDLPNAKIKLIKSDTLGYRYPSLDFHVHWWPLPQAGSYYSSALEVKPANDQSNVLSLTYISENPLLATAILNTLMTQYNNAGIEDKNEMNRKILAFINDRLTLVENQLDSVEMNMQKFRTNRQVIDLTAQSTMYFENVSQLNQGLREQEVQLQVVQLVEDYISQPSNKLSLVPSTLGLTDPTLLELTAAYNKLVVQRLSELQTGATLANPIVLNLERNIEEARVKMLQNLMNIKKVYSNNVRALKSESGSVKKEINSIPERERQTREKAREQEIKQNLYLYMMQKREESEIAQASTIANSRIIDTALPVYTLVKPIKLRIYGIALVLGLLLPILIIYIRDLMNDKVTTRTDITRVTNAPILGEVGHSEEDQVLLFPNSSRSIVAEQMRILRSNLRYVLGEKFETPCILVTSSFSGEGKSFISTNLGATLALSGKRTVILEFDLRKPKILTGLGLPKGNGLTNYLVGSVKLEDLAQPVPQVQDLFVIPCGPVPPNPSEILLTPKIAELFAWLKQNFDAVVIDTAPVGLVSDAFTLSHFADATIYVIRQRYTFKRQINFINELYSQKKMPNMGILVNDVVSEGSRGYYGYGGGRYGYGYGYGYGVSYFEEGDDKRKGLLNRVKNRFSR